MRLFQPVLVINIIVQLLTFKTLKYINPFVLPLRMRTIQIYVFCCVTGSVKM